MAVSDASGAILFRFVYDTYGELSDIKTDNGISLKTLEQLAEYSLAELADAIGTDYLYNGQYGVETDQNGLYYMRARYYNQDIKRFINRDVVSGDITNSQSLNRYCYVQGNPVSLTDPFGLCPTPEEMEWNRFKKKVSNITHNVLDGLGLVFDPADILNAFLYLIEHEYEMAALSVICMFPIVGSIFGLGAKLTMKITDAIGPNVFKQVQKHWDDIVEAGKKLGKATSEKLQKAIKWIDDKLVELGIKSGRNAINLINGLPANQGYSSFGKLKRAIGSPGEGYHWHHIVEQSQIGKSGFSPEQIHNTSNIIAVDAATHAKITGYYNTTTYDFTGGLSVRDWLAGQSYEYQYEFGLGVLRKYGVIK